MERVWEEQGADAECIVSLSLLLDFVEILTVPELDANKHKEPWSTGERRSPELTLVCEGSVARRPLEKALSRGKHKRGLGE